MESASSLEPQIRPLVEALNQTGLVQTFSSCAGHYEPTDQRFQDRNLAYVKFVPAAGLETTEPVERWLGALLVQFKMKHGYMPMHLTGYKSFTPTDDVIEVSFTLELKPFNRFDSPAIKRSDTNRAIEQVVRLLSSNR